MHERTGSKMSSGFQEGNLKCRKALMAELSDAFIALPGGWGTVEEFAEAATWTQLSGNCEVAAVANRLPCPN